MSDQPQRTSSPIQIHERVFFEGFELDLTSGELTKNGELVPLRPLASRGLIKLAANARRVVTHAELREALWGTTHVDWEAGLHQCIRQIRGSLGDQARDPRIVETVPRRGYRFKAALTAGPNQSEVGGALIVESAAPRFSLWSFVAGIAAVLALPISFILWCSWLM